MAPICFASKRKLLFSVDYLREIVICGIVLLPFLVTVAHDLNWGEDKWVVGTLGIDPKVQESLKDIPCALCIRLLYILKPGQLGQLRNEAVTEPELCIHRALYGTNSVESQGAHYPRTPRNWVRYVATNYDCKYTHFRLSCNLPLPYHYCFNI